MAGNKRYAPTDLPTALMRLVQNTLANAAAKVHTHSASDIVSGTLPIERGGTGQTTAAGILSAINAAPADHVHSATTDITSGTLPVARGGTGLSSATENGVLLGGGSSNFKVVASTPGALYSTANGGIPSFGTLPVAEGGTGGTTPATARSNLDVYSKSEVDAKATSLDPMTQAEADAGTSTDQRSISPSVLSTSIGTKLEAWTPRGIFISDVDYEMLTEAEKKNGAVYYVYTVVPPSYDSAAEWAANPSDLKYAADDIAANGTDSAYYAEFAQYMADDASFPVPLENVDSYTSVAEDKILQMRIVGINCKTKSAGGTAGLTFMAKKAHPKANVMNSSSSTSGGWPSMTLRTEMNSGTFWSTLPAAWQNVIAEVSNTSYGPSKTQVTSNDKMWLPSWYELCGSDSSSSYQTEDGPQFPWFGSKGTTNSAVKSTLANMYLTNSGAQPSGLYDTCFWTRSVYPSGTVRFVLVYRDGSHDGDGPIRAYAVLPCFSL